MTIPTLEAPAVAWLRQMFAGGGASVDREHGGHGSLGYGWIHYALVRVLRPERILAIGSRQGFVPACLALAAADNGVGHVDFVDANYRRGQDYDGAEACDGLGWWTDHDFDRLNAWLTLHRQRTDEFFPARSLDVQYGYVSIDGGHADDVVRYDFAESAARLAPAGILALHDCAYPRRRFGVGRLVAELAPPWHVLILPGLAGLALVQKR